MDTNKSTKSTVFIFMLSFVLLVSSFQFDTFGVMHGESIYDNTYDIFSEALVISRISKTHESGYLSKSGFLGKYGEFDSENRWILKQYSIFFDEDILVPQIEFKEYTSNAGLHGLVYSFIDSSMIAAGVKSGYKRLFFHKLINSYLLALVLSLFIVFFF